MLGDGRLIKRRVRDGRGMFHTFFVTVSYLFQDDMSFLFLYILLGHC